MLSNSQPGRSVVAARKIVVEGLFRV